MFVVLCGIDLFYLETEEIIVPENQRTRYTQSLPIFKIEIQTPKNKQQKAKGSCQLIGYLEKLSGVERNLMQLRVNRAILISFSLPVPVYYYTLEGGR